MKERRARRMEKKAQRQMEQRGDGMVQEEAAGLEAVARRGEVRGHPRLPDVFRHPDGGDPVEPAEVSGRVAIIHQLDAHSVAESGRLDALAGERELPVGERDAHSSQIREALGGPDEEPAPAAADVEQAHPVPHAELVQHEVELGLLRLVERGIFGPEVRAAVDQALPEPERVELVADVVVESDRCLIASCAVALAAELGC